MKWFKRAAFSSCFLFCAAGFLWIHTATKESGLAYQKLREELEGRAVNGQPLTQVKECVTRLFTFHNKGQPAKIQMSYPSSRVVKENSIVEEIKELSVEAQDSSSTSTFYAASGRLDYGTNILFAQDATIMREVSHKPVLKALARDISLHLKEASPTFEAQGVKAEICS